MTLRDRFVAFRRRRPCRRGDHKWIPDGEGFPMCGNCGKVVDWRRLVALTAELGVAPETLNRIGFRFVVRDRDA